MWLPNQINPFKYHIVRRFDLIVAIAKVMRGCHFYYVSAPTHSLLGITDGSSTIREVPIPQNIEVSVSFLFRVDTVDKDILSTYVDFALLDDVQWALFPLIKHDEFVDYAPLFKPVTEYKLWTVINKRTRQEIEFLDLYGVEGVKTTHLREVNELIEGYMLTRNRLSPTILTFSHMERNTVIRNVFSSKASMGEKYVHLSYGDKDYSFFLSKALFTFNKNDALTIYATDRIDIPNVFELCFEVKHDKNPIKFVIDGDFIERTHATFIRTRGY